MEPLRSSNRALHQPISWPARVTSVVHIVVPQPAPSVGGSDEHVVGLLRHQRASPLWLPHAATFGDSAYRGRLEALGVPVVHNGRVHRWASVKSVAAFVREQRIELIHSHGYGADYFTWYLHCALRRLGIRPTIVMTVHGLLTATPRQSAMTAWNTFVHRRIADGVIACSEKQMDALRPKRGGRLFHVPHGVAMGLPPVRDRGAGRHVAFVGRLSPEKDPQLFVRAAALIHRRLEDTRFTIVGHGPQANNVRGLINKMGLADAVTMVPYIANVPALLADVDVLVNTSSTEATPRTIIEALAAGAAVVAPEIGDVPRMLGGGDGGWLYDARTPETVADEVIRALTDPIGRAERAARGRAIAMQFYSEDVVFSSLDAVYRSVMEGADA